MKIVFYNGSNGVYEYSKELSKVVGGATKQQWLLGKKLKSEGHEVIFIVPTNDPNQISSEIDGIRFRPSPMTTTNKMVWSLLRNEKPDWLYWRTNSFHLGLCFVVAKCLHISTIYACASDKDCVPKYALNQVSIRRILWPLYKLGLNLSDRIFVQHQGQKDLLAAKFQKKAFIVNNITHLPNIITSKKENFIVWVGNLRYEKRPDLLVEIAKKLPDIKILVIGAKLDYRSQPGYVEEIANQLRKLTNVKFLGFLPPDEVINFMAKASLLLSTSEQEGFPNTMLEAWSVGVPVISLGLDPGGVIKKSDLGVVTKDISSTVAIIKNLLNDDEALGRIGGNAKKYIVENHSPDVVYHQFEQALYNSNIYESNN